MLTTAQAAAELGVGIRRVQAMIAAGRLAAHKVGRDWFIEQKALVSVRGRNPKGGRPKKNSKNSAKKS